MPELESCQILFEWMTSLVEYNGWDDQTRQGVEDIGILLESKAQRERVSVDPVCNNFGYKLIDMCI